MNLLVTGAFKCSEEDLQLLSSLGNEVVFHQFEEQPLPCPYEWVDGVICNGLFLHHKIEKFTNLKYIQLTSVGFDRVDTGYISNKNIKLFNARGVYSVPIAEYVITGVLSLYKQMEFFYKNKEKHNWLKHRSLLELSGKKVCIVGFGNIGEECARRFKAFDTSVYAVDIKRPKSKMYDEFFMIEDLKKALERSDIVVITLPLNSSTSGMFDAEKLSWINKDAILVNVSRGEIIKQDDLIETLKSKKLFGAVLDVFEIEPLDTQNPLWDMSNVIITPHNSFVGENNIKRLKKLVLKNLKENI